MSDDLPMTDDRWHLDVELTLKIAGLQANRAALFIHEFAADRIVLDFDCLPVGCVRTPSLPVLL
jgi:hypothetical protein